jgi:hypothetical protein
MDCTFCLDCIHACPHENVGILTNVFGKELWHDSLRSGVGRLRQRPDLAALVVVLTFGSFVNAAGMVAPVLIWQDRLTSLLRQGSPLLVSSLFYISGVVLLPVLLIGNATLLSRQSGRLEISNVDLATRFSYALVPLGFSMWLAHYSFHFLASYEVVIPVFERFASDAGWLSVGNPAWIRACCKPVAEWLPRLEILFLDMGLLLSLYTGYRIAILQTPRGSQTLRLLAPWAVLIVVLFGIGIWIVLQPMQMRGTLPAAS